MTPTGYAVWSAPDCPDVERDTVSCKHCGRVIVVKPGSGYTVYLIVQPDGSWREEPGAWCRCCMGPVCLPCDDDGRCVPLEKRFEALERRAGGRSR